jgi:hypothetical protein
MSSSPVRNFKLGISVASGSVDPAAGNARRELDWQQGVALAQGAPVAQLEHALLGVVRGKTRALHAVLALPGLGRFDITVRDESAALELHMRCHAAAGHTWLCARRAWLERRLARCLGRRVRLFPVLAARGRAS